jgi:hypothetical protein
MGELFGGRPRVYSPERSALRQLAGLGGAAGEGSE